RTPAPPGDAGRGGRARPPRVRPSAAAPRPRGHREPPPPRDGLRARLAPRAEGDGRERRDRRLRERVLPARLPAAPPRGRPEDRPLVPRGRGRWRALVSPPPGHRRPRQGHGPRGRGRGDRDPVPEGSPPRLRLRAGPGLPLRPPDGRRPLPRPAAVGTAA